ncbi:MAG: hypothetical protein QM689_02935 [Oscillospiraceae bacterium]
MNQIRFCYLVLCVAAFFFYILYVDNLSFYLFALLLALPAVMLATVLYTARHIRASVSSDNVICMNNEQTTTELVLENTGFLPATKLCVTLRIIPRIGGKPASLRFFTAVPPGETQRLAIPLTPVHCGLTEVKIDRIKVYDFLRLFTKRVRLDEKKRVRCSRRFRSTALSTPPQPATTRTGWTPTCFPP